MDGDLEIDVKSQLDFRHIVAFVAEHDIPQEVIDRVMAELEAEPDKFIHEIVVDGQIRYTYADRVQQRMYELNENDT